MSFIAAGIIAGAGIAKAISGGVQKKKAKAAAAEAQAELDAQKNAFKNLDTTNPYANMENTMEDLTVNQEEAQFVAEQQQQGQANILQDLRGAAGSSGIAGLAQTLASQGSKNARQAAISIGKQESANQVKERAEASRLQGLDREGDIMSRQMVADKNQALMGMAAQDVSSAKAAQAAADSKMWSGISSAAGGVAGGVTAGLGNVQAGQGFFGGAGGGGVPSMSNMTMMNPSAPAGIAAPSGFEEFQSPASGQFDFINNLGMGYGPQNN